jgi:hypothetical protein
MWVFSEAMRRWSPRLVRAGLMFDLPDLQDPQAGAPVAPGTDPIRPPRLR